MASFIRLLDKPINKKRLLYKTGYALWYCMLDYKEATCLSSE